MVVNCVHITLMSYMCIFTIYIVSPTFLSSTHFNEDDSSVNFIKITDPDAYSMYCSYNPPTTNVAVSCKATGVPMPNISIFREDTEGNKRMFPVTFQEKNEVASEIIVGVPSLRYGELIILCCVASNIVSTVTISINLTYTCK